MLPFTAEEFFAVFSDYNETVWPMQWVLTAAAIAVVALSVSRAARAPRLGVLSTVPLVWSIVGGSAAFLLGVWQDLGLIVSAIIAAGALGVDRIRAARS